MPFKVDKVHKVLSLRSLRNFLEIVDKSTDLQQGFPYMVDGGGSFANMNTIVSRNDKGVWELIASTLSVGVRIHRAIICRHSVIE